MEESKKVYTNVTFRVPAELYMQYKITLLKRQETGRKTPTADLNAHIRNTVENYKEE